MAPIKNNMSSSNNRNGEAVGRQANVLASCYIVDASTRLTGFHYSTTGAGGKSSFLFVCQILNMKYYNLGSSGIPEVMGNPQGLPSPPSSPPLAALTSANELALTSTTNPNRKRDVEGRRRSRREGAAYTIREECERLFCENMKVVFFGEEGRTAGNASIVMGANAHSPPDENVGARNGYFDSRKVHPVDAWLEMWDYSSGCSFRGFVGGQGDSKALFAFFDSAVVGREIKHGLMALIELAEEVFAVGQVVICLDRLLAEEAQASFLKNLRWVGFEMITMDMWASERDVTSNKWLLMGMEI